MFAPVLLVAFLAAVFSYSNAETTTSNFEYGSPEISISLVRQSTSECEKRTKKSIFTYGTCPEVCKKFDPVEFSKESTACAPLLQFGCRMVPCQELAPELAFSCSLDATVIRATHICPGDKILFDGINMGTFVKVSYSIDLGAPPVKTDIYFLADNTGGMRAAIEEANRRAVELTAVYGVRKNVAFGVGRYGDERELDGGFEHQLSLTEDKSAAQKAIKKWTAQAGGDSPEATLVALYKIATDGEIGWREGSRKIVVFFGDAPGHEPTCIGSKAITRGTVIEEMNKKGISVVAIGLGSSRDSLNSATRSFPAAGCGGRRSAPSGQSSAITYGTGGEMLEGTPQSELVDGVITILDGLTRTYDVDVSDCEEKIISKHTPSLPLQLGPNEKATVVNTIMLKNNDICMAGGKFECQYKYTESGAGIEDGTALEFVNIKGC